MRIFTNINSAINGNIVSVSTLSESERKELLGKKYKFFGGSLQWDTISELSHIDVSSSNKCFVAKTARRQLSYPFIKEI